jgi:phospholipid/cholesterol/gamma-HCH transport system substrate-binding protein
MMQKKAVELWVGVFVALGILALGMLAFKVGNLSTADVGKGYVVEARFDNIGGLKVKAPVTLAGVRIGRVASIGVDKQTFRAVVDLDISGKYDNLPTDTTAMIQTAGVLGEQYVALAPGADETFLKNGDRIILTQSAVVLENLIGQFLYNRGESQSK